MYLVLRWQWSVSACGCLGFIERNNLVTCLHILISGTALSQAISLKNLEMVKLLVEMGAEVSQACFDGISPLGKAVRERQTEIALYLMSQPSCDFNALDPVSKQV
jgi:ankyrin repeat protein